MTVVNMHEAKTHLSKLVERAAQGEEVVIAKAGRPVARLVPYVESDEPRKLGAWKGRIWMADDFDELPPDILAAFEGDEP
ncbi:MAG: type II toxin-antitoxin system Phd/YefM family antitoxin [Gaiella sp.]|nr:type II toxin-antitoxin system Phd/YefM family antitoxin [Gaiella sp.]